MSWPSWLALPGPRHRHNTETLLSERLVRHQGFKPSLDRRRDTDALRTQGRGTLILTAHVGR